MKIYYSSLLFILSIESGLADDNGVEFGIIRKLHEGSHSMSVVPYTAKSLKAGKQPKISKVFSVDVTADDDDAAASGDVPTSSASDDFLSYATKTEKVVVFSKTGKEAKAADDGSEDDASVDVDAKSSKVVAKVVRAIPVEATGTTGATSGVNAAENTNASLNASVINGAGTLFVVLTFAAVGAMLA